MRWCVGIVVALAGCGSHGSSAAGSGQAAAPGATTTEPAGSAASSPASTWTCEQLPFAIDAPVPEASGAAWTDDGIYVISDSGNHGAYVVLDPDDGHVRKRGTAPLGATSDDLEGLAPRGDRLFGITSAGWIYEWKRGGAELELVRDPYPIAPVDPSQPLHGGLGDKPPKGDGMACGARGVNCGRNYEGLALVDDAHAAGPCTGFVVAKADGHLYCLVLHDGKLAVDRARALRLDRPGVVADCNFADDGSLWIGNNLFGLSRVSRVVGWQDLAHARVEPVAAIGVGFPEVVLAHGDLVYRMSDTGGAPSLVAKFRCTPASR